MAFTSIPAKPETLRRLKAYKVGGKTYDTILNDLMDAYPSERYWADYEEELRAEAAGDLTP